ncbi:DNA-(apurinic or apyrimidinic site) lyase-like isoform X2 [Thrips palmi]|uniref:DNA-(apurinic or apyrimidinic site) endonuclease n=1 Tax=Thrips palmi TaxID=161013 RepID=A0A6P8YNM0_THRPL|nr:DNA-(apurinic or apyrimidinic site) lyase-like isoform X2 [Thrips palmi]
MFCAAFCRFVWSQCCILGVVPGKYFQGSHSLTSVSALVRQSFASQSRPFSRAAAQFYVCSNMPPRGKAKAKEVEENGKERQVRQSRNVKAASYKDLSDSEDEKPIRKRGKKESESESMSEEEKPKARGKKGRRAPARSRKRDVSDSEEASDFVSSDDSSAEESSKRKKGGRKPTRSMRTNKNTSYKDLSDSEEESVEEDEDSVSEKEEKSSPKRGRGRPAAKKSKKEESSEGEEEEEEDVEDEAGEDSEEDKKDESKSEKPKSKPKSATADSSTDDNAKDKSDSKEEEKVEKDDKPRPEHELSEEEEDDEDDEDSKGKSSKKGKNDEKKSSKKGKDEDKDPKKRSRADKNGEEATGDVKEEPQAKKAKVEEKTLLNKTDTDYDSIEFTSNAKTKDGDSWNLKISSWNVAGLRAWIKKNGLEYIKHEKPDILCLQETKCSEQKLPPEAKFEGYETYWLSGEKEGQAGVAVLSKTKPLEVKYGIDKPEFDADGRVITAEYEKFYLVNTYVPNAGNGLKTLPRRLEWDPAFRAYLKKLDEKKPVILCGDLNVAHSEIDLANPKTNQKTAGFTPQEREGMTDLLKEGFVDTFRSLYPDKKSAYSFWSYFNNARSRNIGWRLDYFITSERFLPNICDNIIRNEVFGSDHCPITLLAHV